MRPARNEAELRILLISLALYPSFIESVFMTFVTKYVDSLSPTSKESSSIKSLLLTLV